MSHNLTPETGKNVPKGSHAGADSNVIRYLFCVSICFESDILEMMTTCIGKLGGSIGYPSSELEPARSDLGSLAFAWTQVLCCPLLTFIEHDSGQKQYHTRT